jgi:hypothetical protein
VTTDAGVPGPTTKIVFCNLVRFLCLCAVRNQEKENKNSEETSNLLAIYLGDVTNETSQKWKRKGDMRKRTMHYEMQDRAT